MTDRAIGRRHILAGAGVVALAAPALARAQNAAAIRIGEINSYTAQPAFLQPYRNGWTVAQEQVNAAGGINGRRIETLFRDDAGRPEDAVRMAGELVDAEKVTLLAGGFLSNVGLALGDFANQNKRLFVRQRAADRCARLGRGNRYTFRLRASTYMQSAMLVEEAAKLPAKRWATVAPNYEYGQSAVRWFKELLARARPDVDLRRRAIPGARPHRCRRHRAGAGRRQSRGDLQRHLRRRPDQFRPPGHHARAVRAAQGGLAC